MLMIAVDQSEPMQFGGLVSSSNRTIDDVVTVDIHSEQGAIWSIDFRE